MPTYNIQVVIDPADASRGASVVEARLVAVETKAKSVDTAVQRAFDFNTGPAVAATSAVDKALDGVTTSANAAGAAVDRAMNRAGGAAVANNNKIINSNGQVRASQISLGQQFNDFSTQVLAGGSVVTAFAQQSGQAAFALSGMNGVLGTVGRFLAGPWGTILIIATTILANFVSKMWDTKDATEAAEAALKKFQQRQSDIGNFIDATTGKLKEQNRTLIQNAILTRQAQIDANKKTITTGTKSAFDRATGAADAAAPDVFAERGLSVKVLDPDISRVIVAANGDVQKLDLGLQALARRRPALKGVINDISLSAAQTVIAARENQRLSTEIDQLNGKTNERNTLTSNAVERQVRLATATTAVERAQARLSEVQARGAAIDKMDDPKQRSAALDQYRKDLTGATLAVASATAAQRSGREATSAHNAELRKQAALAERVADFLSKLKDQGDALEVRGTDSTIAQQVDAFKRQFNRAPSGDERQQIENAVRRNQLLTDEKAILDQLLGPFEQYQRQVAALNDLLARGKITQDEYNQSIRELPLTQALASVDKSLTGTLFEYDAQVQAIRDSIAKAIKVVDDAQKAGIIDPVEAERRRTALRGPAANDNGDIVVTGGPPRNLQDQQIAQLNRQRRDPLRQIDLGLTNRPDLQRNAQIEGVNNGEQDDLLKLQQAKQEGLLNSEQEYQDRKTAIIQKAEEDRQKIEQSTTDVRLAAAASTADSLLSITESLAGKQSAAYKAMFIVTKAFAIAEAVINIQRALASATASLPFPANLPVIAMVAAQGASIIAAITSIAGSFQEGGYTGDRGESEVAGVVHGKEFVMNARATRENRAMLEAMNAGRTVRETRAMNSSNDNSLRPLNVRVDTSEMPGSTAEVQYVTRDEARVMIKKGVASDAPKVVSGQLADPNSRVSKGIYRTTTAKRKRG